MVRCIDCGFCGFYVNLADGLRWHEMNRQLRLAFEQGNDRRKSVRSPGTGHWRSVTCSKELHEWSDWLEGAPGRDVLEHSLKQERDCGGYIVYRLGFTPPEHRAFDQPGSQVSVTEITYDVFLSHSSLDDELAKEVQKLLEGNGVRTFATPDSIPTGAWEPQIEKALQGSQDVWVLLTPNAINQSLWVHHEFGYFYGFRHGQGKDQEGHRCHYLYVPGTVQPGLYAWIMGTPIQSFDDPVTITETIVKALNREFNVPTGYLPRSFTHVQTPLPPPELRRPWLLRPGAPQFRMNPGIHQGTLLNSFEITAAVPPVVEVEARWTGAGVDMDWVKPMKENRPGKYQMRPVAMAPTPPSDTVAFEVRFYLEDGQHGGRWHWLLRRGEKGHWEMEAHLGSGVFQPMLEDTWGPSQSEK